MVVLAPLAGRVGCERAPPRTALLHAEHAHQRAELVHQRRDIGMALRRILRGGARDDLVGALVERILSNLDGAGTGVSLLAEHFLHVAGERQLAGQQLENTIPIA